MGDFEADGLRLAVRGGGFSGKVSGRITGLPDIDRTRIDTRLHDFLLTSNGLEDFLSQWTSGNDPEFSRFAKGLLFSMNGRASGLLNNLLGTCSSPRM